MLFSDYMKIGPVALRIIYRCLVGLMCCALSCKLLQGATIISCKRSFVFDDICKLSEGGNSFSVVNQRLGSIWVVKYVGICNFTVWFGS